MEKYLFSMNQFYLMITNDNLQFNSNEFITVTI